MSISAIVKALIASGATPDMILAAVQADENARLEKEALARESARQRKIKSRNNNNHVTVTPVTDCDTCDNSSPLNAPLDGGLSFSPAPLNLSNLNPPLNPPTSVFRKNDPPNRFSEIWDAFPAVNRSKGSRKKAETAYLNALKKTSHQEIFEGIHKYAEYLRSNGQSNADAFRWLQDERWGDEYAYAIQQPGINKPTAIDRIAQGIAEARAMRQRGTSGQT